METWQSKQIISAKGVIDNEGTPRGILMASDDSQVVQMADENGNSFVVDLSTRAFVTIDYAHHEVHGGSLYRAGVQKDVANGGTAIFGITTPDTTKWLHFRPEVDVEAEAHIQLVENPDAMTGGSSITPRNANRNSANVSGATVVVDPSVTVGGGMVLGNVVIGSGKSTGGGAAPGHEWILKQNTKYALIVTNHTTGDNEVNIKCVWYEHEDKN